MWRFAPHANQSVRPSPGARMARRRTRSAGARPCGTGFWENAADAERQSRGLPPQAIERSDARTFRSRDGNGRRPLRRPEARGAPRPLRPAPGTRRHSQVVGRAPRSQPRPRGQAPGGGHRGPPAGVRRFRGIDPRRQLRRRGDDRLGQRPLAAARGPGRRVGERQAPLRTPRLQAARRLDPVSHRRPAPDGRRQPVADDEETRRGCPPRKRGRRGRPAAGVRALGPDRRGTPGRLRADRGGACRGRRIRRATAQRRPALAATDARGRRRPAVLPGRAGSTN